MGDSWYVSFQIPIYFHDLPLIVEEFAAKAILYDKYVFAVSTFHKEPGNALFNLNTILEQRGSKLSAGFCVNMPGNSVLIMDLTSPDDENERRFIEEKEKIKEISEIVKMQKTVGIEGYFDMDEKYDIKNYVNYIYKPVEKLWVNEECNLCGLCTKVCPKKSIEIADDKVTWKDNCEKCLACLHWCPKAAIQNGEVSKKCRRYHHPDISVQDIINQV